ncbi:MAG TPA: arginine deiminase-related protein [Gammaproteobacteria bacterium]|nr:arginine deiminase-related protein [Gammaproteobacteria bacterium]
MAHGPTHSEVAPDTTEHSPRLTPSGLDKPAFLLNVPFSLAGEVANNAWMADMAREERVVDLHRAINQFLQLYHFLAAETLVYLLPTPAEPALQDLVYTGNLGIVPAHLEGGDTVILSNFRTEVRRPETEVGRTFFETMGYQVLVPPYYWEGEAELKHLHGSVYAGGHGVRSDPRAYDWMAEQLGMEIVSLTETDPYLYHLDCTVFPLTREDTLVCTEMFTEAEVRALERVTNIIDVSVDDCYSGICNSVRVGNTLVNASHLFELKPRDEEYAGELHKNRTLEDLAARYGFEAYFFNLSEFLKSGALLSCMVMHLNRKSYDLVLV